MCILKIGDKLADDSIIVRDEDRLCYQVFSTAKGATGLRTINKTLLEEWVIAVRQHPNYSSSELRDLLSGKTEIDKFEYGYAATLKKMADMVNGNVEVVHAKADYSAEFCRWFAENRGKGKDTTAKKYISYFKTLTDTYQEPTNSYWHGLYRVMYSVDAEKDVIEIGEPAEFDRIYGGIVIALEGKVKGVGMTHEGFQRAIDWFWKPEVKSHTCVTSALNAYSDFLKWRVAQQKKSDAPVLEADLLSIALKIFAEKRYEVEWQGKTNSEEHQSIYSMSDLTPEQLAAGALEDFYNDFLLKVWVFKNGGSRKYGQLDDAEKTAYRQFVVDLKTQLKSFDAYFPPNKKCPAGMGVGMLTEIMMRFWPKSCCSYNANLIHEALVTLGMAEGDFVWPKTPSIYQDFMGKCATILRKMEQMKLPRRPEPGNDEPPDYITVNEFLWFVHDYKDLIKEKVMKKQFKNVAKKPKGGDKDLSSVMKDDLLLRLAAALRTKPFAILAGHSGTGKSQIVRRLAYMTCIDETLMDESKEKNAPGNYCMIQVRPNWHDSTDLLGYYSEMKQAYRSTDFVRFVAKAYAYPEVPFFVCLDEMNLAPVEQYFAEYLSAIESADLKGDVFLTDALIPKCPADEVIDKEEFRFTESKDWLEAHGLTIPKNLFVVGTVNMDDTTCQFSRKVLDRAMTIMMDKVKFEDMQDQAKSAPPSSNDLLKSEDVAKFLAGKLRADPLSDDQVALLNKVNGVLGRTAFAVAYRFANEYALYEDSLAALTGKTKDAALAAAAMDHCILMKVLPRIHGERGYVTELFKGNAENEGKGLEGTLGNDANALSVKKMEEILLRKDTYLSFWP